MLDPAMFKDYPDLKVGDMVRFDVKPQVKLNYPKEGVGWVRLIWMGIEEMCEIQCLTGIWKGRSVTICRAVGDKVELL